METVRESSGSDNGRARQANWADWIHRMATLVLFVVVAYLLITKESAKSQSPPSPTCRCPAQQTRRLPDRDTAHQSARKVKRQTGDGKQTEAPGGGTRNNEDATTQPTTSMSGDVVSRSEMLGLCVLLHLNI